jgi:aspartate aminotransferase-like enzyme
MFDSDVRFILSPGPVHIAAESLRELPLLHHRSDEFRSIMTETELMVKELLGTVSPVYFFTASGTGAMEAAVANTTDAGSRALVISGGKFGDRWAELFEAYECRTDIMRFPEGTAIAIDAVLERVERTRPELLALTHVESSTGLLFPLRELLCNLAGERPVVIVDAISSFGVEELDTDRWGIDIVVGASQKALMAPPGVSFMSMSERAFDLAKKRRRCLYYFDVSRYEGGRERGNAPFTPAIQTIQVMHRSLSMFKKLGFQSVTERHRKASSALLSAAEHLSFISFSEVPSSSVQVLVIPDFCRGIALQAALWQAGFVVAGGQGELRGKVIRTGFLGVFGSKVLMRFVEEIARIMEREGHRVDSTAAQEAVRAGFDFGYLF